jgi:hypothetical protein
VLEKAILEAMANRKLQETLVPKIVQVINYVKIMHAIALHILYIKMCIFLRAYVASMS